MRIKVEAKRPSECTQERLKSFIDLIVDAGEVVRTGLEARVAAAERLIFMYSDEGALIGVAAVKRPSEHHTQEVFSDAKTKAGPANYEFEIGWIVIRDDPRYRGKKLSRPLVEECMEITGKGKVFATARSTNTPMIRTLNRYGFRASGRPYPTRRAGSSYALTLFIKR